ncbi:RNA polymerase sigma factor [Acidiluteibacter ferrifornacis]|uniref:Sigma-70 family RNA polymerase sigma factor n=1 Tax=Acidiluteibacter ferrifornacis TaxID=2692424 RepID=A0A6N9NPP1_9FLAO|nr:RNA polymerase sigma factor [Acidiluteibacter ferrifornacis]MBR9832324.1 RNA polymerase sigma factor [bacterium]NBG66395.1 sigma-70 family RNA polymerase sigma factor [Acidiluteibacter ferrifornacis]
MQEQELIEKCIKGHRISQRKLYDTYKTPMYTLAYRITNSFEDAEDVLQEGFLKVFRNLNSFKNDSKLSTWIHTIIVRTAYRKIKDTINYKTTDILEDESLLEIVYPSDVDYLEKAIQSLPDGYRTVFTLYEIEGYKHHEIAELLEISTSTSKTQLRNAKITLRDQLKNFSING